MDPYLSIVVAARNDNYEGDFLGRAQRFIKVLAEFQRRHALEIELIVVEWNPPSNRARLLEALVWPHFPNGFRLRIIEVPDEIHRNLPNADKIALFEYLAKNVGIRRARGRFTLTTNPDVLFSEELITYLASRRLDDHCFYRIDRYDFSGSPNPMLRPEDILKFAKRRVFQVHVRIDGQRQPTIRIDNLRRLCGLWLGKWPTSYTQGSRGIRFGESAVILYDERGPYGGVHTNASGDFLLTSSENWRRIGGFPEFSDTFTHLDSYACHQLKALGLKQILLLPPCMLLHEEHSRAQQINRPYRPNCVWEDDLKAIREGCLGPNVNGTDWGLGNQSLPEVIIGNGSSA